MALNPTKSTDRVLTWIQQNLIIPEGEFIGQPLMLERWQREFFSGALAEGINQAALSVARANGKTTMAAALCAVALLGPLQRARGQIILVASSFQQARLCFDHVKEMLAERIEEDPASWRIQDSVNVASLTNLPSKTILRCIGSDPSRMHGLAPSLVICDEPAQWPSQTSRRAYSALKTALGKQPGARLICIGTRPSGFGHWFSQLLDAPPEDAFSVCHSAPDDSLTWKNVQAANPSVRRQKIDRPCLRRVLKAELQAAKRAPDMATDFLAYRLNRGTREVETLDLISPELWEKSVREGVKHKGRPIWGIDLGATFSFSAVAAYYPESETLDAFSMVGSDPDLREREARDSAPAGSYIRMYEREELVIQSGVRVPSVAALLEEALSRFGTPSAIACDRYRQGDLLDGLSAVGIVADLHWRGAGYRDATEDVRGFQTEFLNGHVHPESNYMLTTAIAEARCRQSESGDLKLWRKGSPGSVKPLNRDDGAVATVYAVGLASRLKSGLGEPVFTYHGVA